MTDMGSEHRIERWVGKTGDGKVHEEIVVVNVGEPGELPPKKEETEDETKQDANRHI